MRDQRLLDGSHEFVGMLKPQQSYTNNADLHTTPRAALGLGDSGLYGPSGNLQGVNKDFLSDRADRATY